MNGSPQPETDMQAPCCGNCPLLVKRDLVNKTGICIRYPPTIVSMIQSSVDIAQAQREIKSAPQAITLTRNFNEACGEHPAIYAALYRREVSAEH